jgi:protein phosphatase
MTDVGNVRKLNEDEFFIDEKYERLFLVADGMGGHNAGDVASKMAVNIVRNYYLENIHPEMPLESIKEAFLDAIKIANETIIRASKKFDHLKNMGTTLNLVYIHSEDLIFINIGDSRAYIFNEDILKQITVDHSLVEELLRTGRITATEAHNHPQKNIITSCLGTKEDYKVDVYRIKKTAGIKILLCTDGLTNLIEHTEIEETIRNMNVHEATEKLVSLAKVYGGFDNITLILIKLEKPRDIDE